jgi:hypothetical protein
VVTPEGNTWLGGLAGDDVYEALIDWARAVHGAQVALPLPARFDAHRFERFAAEGVPA